MKKKKIANLIMVFIIAIIVAAGVLTVGWIQGWFDNSENAAQVSSVRGVVNIQRAGVAYPVEPGTVLRDQDQLTCTPGSTAVLSLNAETYAVIGENADVLVQNAQLLSLEILKGEVFIVSNGSPLDFCFSGRELHAENAVISLSVRDGAQTLSVYQGTVADVQEGYAVNWLGEETSSAKLAIAALNAFTINQLRNVNQRITTCFSTEDLDRLEEERFIQMQNRIQAASQAAEATSASEESGAKTSTEENAKTSTASSGNGTQTEAPGASGSNAVETSPANSTENAEEKPEGGAETNPAPEASPQPTTAAAETTPVETTPAETEKGLSCYISIYCDTILDNWDNLASGKGAYVPSNGVILYSTEVEFTEGETVFDVLKRICEACGIQLEYSWTPMYNSYYVEGINHLYEFDCGPESGWMYKVNEWFPNYGCSAYTLTGGEDIVWCYTCNGYGEDVGSVWME